MAQLARPLREVIAGSLGAWSTPRVELAVFGSDSPDRIGEVMEQFCAVHLGADPTSCLFWRSSVGVATGLVLDDDSRVVIKGYPPTADRTHLIAVTSLRQRLLQAGLPCPAPLGGPHPLGSGLATIEAFVEAPPPVDGLRPEHRELLARGLHGFIGLATPLASDLVFAEPSIGPPAEGGLWPMPHSLLFDFARSAEGAEIIDEIAEVARSRMVTAGDDELIVAHLDWRVEHVRVAEGEIVTVFDWDDVHRVAEVSAVGGAAAHFAATWHDELPRRRYPTPDESDAFVASYAAARERPFSDVERRAIGAARTYGIAHAARCAHQPERPATPGGAEEMLLRFGERYLVVRG